MEIHMNSKSNIFFDQYDASIKLYDSELNRFWTRFNIFLGLQIGFFALTLNAIKFLVPNPVLFRTAIVVLLLISIANAITALRDTYTQLALLKLIWIRENKSNGQFSLLHDYREVSNVPLIINNIVVLFVSFGLLTIWITLFVYLELKEYVLILQ